MSKVTKPCNCCGAKERPDWIDDPQHSETWVWITCDTCNEVVCENCRELGVDYNCTCSHCLQTIAARG